MRGKPQLPQGSYSEAVQKSLIYILQNSHVIKSVAEAAEHAQMNYHTLRARFRRETRITLEECLIRARVDKALRLILESDLLIKEIAWEVGYQNESQLTKAMKRMLGKTPQMLRRQAKISHMVGLGLQRARVLF